MIHFFHGRLNQRGIVFLIEAYQRLQEPGSRLFSGFYKILKHYFITRYKHTSLQEKNGILSWGNGVLSGANFGYRIQNYCWEELAVFFIEKIKKVLTGQALLTDCIKCQSR